MAFNLRSQTPIKQIGPNKKKNNSNNNRSGSKYKTLESKVNAFLGDPQGKAVKDSDIFKNEEPVDNIRHTSAGRYTQESISRGLGSNPMSNIVGVIGSNLFGAAHEVKNIAKDKRPWKNKLMESGEDMINNSVGSVIGAIPIAPKTKTNIIRKLSFDNLLPDGYNSSPDEVKKGFSKEVYFKDNKNRKTNTIKRYSKNF